MTGHLAARVLACPHSSFWCLNSPVIRRRLFEGRANEQAAAPLRRTRDVPLACVPVVCSSAFQRQGAPGKKVSKTLFPLPRVLLFCFRRRAFVVCAHCIAIVVFLSSPSGVETSCLLFTILVVAAGAVRRSPFSSSSGAGACLTGAAGQPASLLWDPFCTVVGSGSIFKLPDLTCPYPQSLD